MIVAGENFRFGRARAGDLDLLSMLGFDVRPVPLVEHVSSTSSGTCSARGEIERASTLLGRPPELDGTVVTGDARGGTLGFPDRQSVGRPAAARPCVRNLRRRGRRARAAISIGTNPHYGGDERRIEAFLLDFEGDLYGRRLVVELWKRLRDERVFESEQDLIDQIALDVDEARRAVRPS